MSRAWEHGLIQEYSPVVGVSRVVVAVVVVVVNKIEGFLGGP
jgi:hypothetical protein